MNTYDSPRSTEGTGNFPPERDTSQVKALAKGLRALDMLLDSADVGTVELARALDVDKGAASRILRTLELAGYAIKNPARRYQAGPKLRRGSVTTSTLVPTTSIRERARPLLERLYAVTRETAHLAVRADDRVLYLDKVDTDLPLRVDRPVGTLAPLHCTALGKVLLAFGDAPLPRNLASFTTRTPIDPEALRAELKQIVEVGYSRDDEEFALGIRCVAAPLREPATGAVIAAIGISGPTARIAREQLKELGELVKQVSREFDA